ncbi:hypothetical protein A3Q56_04012 [Intoshia linei]|uniref:G8 domain-containing protein n=1 Tax=Intoshia linei TaxID=1819745 RepID=A0A177B1V1_9BILA|nr:hypothetical protein A3Q56_04012 [Intoshia linei]
MDYTEPILIQVSVLSKGIAINNNAYFEYIDLWSSRHTWGGANLPIENDFVVITSKQHIRLDISTPKLSMLLIKGGKLSFAEQDIELKVDNILITEGGIFQVGTEEIPFEHRATITMTGKIRAPELPIYGAKTLAIREGGLELHGRKTPETWSLLAETINIGENTIILTTQVNWLVGDEIVIASTGDHNSQNENEKFSITNIAADEKTITLNKNAEYRHLGITETYANGASIELRAEVGLLTHNIVFQGSYNDQWADVIEKCPERFDTGQFAVQTCFQGRFGAEVGSDEFGGQIMAHGHEYDSNSAKIHIEYVELFNVGQAFRLGRYPVHFHINGNMEGSYVKGCSIHKTYNRAINIHNSHHILIERNVIYDVMGGAVFLEDSIERENILQYNLLVHVKSSSSLLTDDISPAGLWVTHPYNIVRHNHIAGGTHFGIWYRMREHPEGPSYDSSICPRFAPLLECFNNTAHSVGWYGLWIFEHYDPRSSAETYGSCSNSGETVPAIFDTMIVWNSLRGAEWVRCSSIQFINFIVGNNFEAGLEHVHIMHHTPQYSTSGAMVKDSTIISHFNYPDRPPCSRYGTTLPFGNGLLYDNVGYINFDGESNGRICSAFGLVIVVCECTSYCGGYSYRFKNIQWINSEKRSYLKWEHMLELVDLDGSLTGGLPDSRIIASTNLVPASICSIDTTGRWNVNFSAMVCRPGVDLFRFSFNEALPESLLYKDIIVTNSHGLSIVPFIIKRDVHREGWMFMGSVNDVHSIVFHDAEQLVNISYIGKIWELPGQSYVLIRHMLKQPWYDIINISTQPIADHNYTMTTALDVGIVPWSTNNIFGDYYHDSVNMHLTYLGVCSPYNIPICNLPISFKSLKCFYYGCELPEGGDEVEAVTVTPDDYLNWSHPSSWSNVETNNKGYSSILKNGIPDNAAIVIIPRGVWIIVDNIPYYPIFEQIIVRGTLEIKDNTQTNILQKLEIHAINIVIYGGHIFAGTHEKSFTRKLDIILYGNHDTPEFPSEFGPKIGSKSISVFGTLQLFGSLRGNSQAELVNSVHTGESLILLNKKVNWVAGDEIIITTSSFYSHETEIFTIVSIELQSLITLDHTLKYDHIIIKESVSQGAKYTNYEIKVYVALVSRNIKIIGNDGGVMMSQSFGGRILVGRTTEVKIVDNIPKTKSYKGKIRLESVEFKYCGQEGFVSPSDPRFPVSFVDIRNDVNEVKDNFVKNCAFNHCFSPAIGVFASDNIDIIRNIVYHTVGSAIITNGQNTVITHNLVVTNKFTGTYNRRYESSNLNYDGSVHTVDSINTICRNNIVIGSERAAFNVGGELCVSSESNAWSNNLIGASFMGVLIEPDNCQALKIENQPKCTKIRSFIIWRTWSYGIYVQSKCSTIFSENTLIDTKIGTFALVIGQSPTLHSLSKKFVIIERSLYVGQSKNFDCAKYNIENTEEGFVKIASNALPPRIGGKQAYHAILWPNSNEMDNMFPELLFHLTKGLFLLSFDIDVRHTDFVNYNIGCQNSINYMFVYNPLNKDFDHMIKTSGIKTFNVAENNIVKFGRPKVSNIITFGGCIDMDCDAKKKLMIKDMDATLFKSFINRQNVKHTIISDSAFEWNGDRRRGYGDYRIPKTMATDLDGNRIPYNEIYKKIGVQNYNCVWNDVWTAYKCDKGDYYHLLLESLDPDTLIRRIGPVAILSGDLFLDILNGPSDHGICEGYACRHRLSAYWPIVVANSNYTIHLTATPPQNLRLWLPSTKKIYISVALYYATSQRIDVTANGAYVVPSNRELVAPGQFRFKNVLHPFASIFKSISGDHIYDIVSKTLYITLESNIDYKIKIIPVVRFSFQLPDMTIDEFFGIDIIDNLRIFLGLDPSQVRIVNIISETAPLNRKRQVPWTGLSVQLEFGDNPGMQSPVIQYNKLKQISDQLGEAIQSNTISSVMNATVINMIIYDAIPYSSDPIYAEYITVSDANVGEFQPKAIISIPDSVVITQQPINIHENVYFEKPIVVCVYDVNKIPIMTLYSSSGLWQIKLTLLDENDTVIHSIKNNIGDVIAGCAKFTDLIIYSVNATKQYRLDVKVLHNFFESLVLQTIPFQIQKQLIEAPLLSMKVEPNTLFAFKAKIVDFLTRSTVHLEDQTWEITIAPDLNCADNMKLEMYDGENQQISNITINLDPNKKYSSMQTTELIKIMNNESIFTFFSKIKGSLEFTAVESFATVYVGSILENVEIDSIKKNMIFKLDEKFTALKNISFEGVSLCLKTKIEKINRNIIISNFSLTDGSILVNTNINGTSIELDSFINDVKSMLGMNELFRYSHFSAHFNSYLAVDGIVVQEEMDDYTTTILIAVLVPFFLIIISILIIVIIYFVNRNKNKLRPQRSSVKVESILTENVAKV